MRRLLVVLAAALLAAPAAQAAPKIDRAVLLSAAAPNFAWDGERATAAAPQQSQEGFDPNKCTKESNYFCDVTLVKLDAAEGTTADLEFAIFDFAPAFSDFDLSIFRSDAAGEPGEFIANGGNLSAAGLEETVPVSGAEPGFYLVTVSYYFAPDATFKGTIKASGITPPPAAPPSQPAGPPAAPPPAAGPLPLAFRTSLGSASRATKKRAIALRATARSSISDLTLVLRDRRGKVVATGRAAQIDIGSRTLRLRVSKRLRRGRYSLTAIGISEGAKRTVTRSVRLAR